MQGDDNIIIVIVRIAEPAHHELLAAIHAINGLSPLFGLAQGGQQHGGQNGNNGNNHQQFNEGKAFAREPDCLGRNRHFHMGDRVIMAKILPISNEINEIIATFLNITV